MSDIEMVRLCAEAMGLWFGHSKSDESDNLYVSSTGTVGPWEVYNPIHDDAHCFALVKQFKLGITFIDPARPGKQWMVREES
jgi:hypothetical protein